MLSVTTLTASACCLTSLLPPPPPTVPWFPRVCTETEFACHSYNECVALEYRCDQRPDCRDMSDELDCGEEVLGTSRGSWWPAQGRATSEFLGHLGCTGLVQAERSGEGGDGDTVMAEAACGLDFRECGGLWGEG